MWVDSGLTQPTCNRDSTMISFYINELFLGILCSFYCPGDVGLLSRITQYFQGIK